MTKLIIIIILQVITIKITDPKKWTKIYIKLTYRYIHIYVAQVRLLTYDIKFIVYSHEIQKESI